jgi:hypothetical protein
MITRRWLVNNRINPSADPPGGVDTASRDQPSLTELVSGIVTDAQTLLRQQVVMLRSEFREDMRRTKEAAKYMGIGATVATVGTLFLLVALVYLLQWLTAPHLPEWACWAIVGGVLAVGGLIAMYAGKRIFDSFNPLPDKTANALQENVSWITSRQS